MMSLLRAVAMPWGTFSPQNIFFPPPPVFHPNDFKCVIIRPNLTISAYKMANFCMLCVHFKKLFCPAPIFLPPPKKKFDAGATTG